MSKKKEYLSWSIWMKSKKELTFIQVSRKINDIVSLSEQNINLTLANSTDVAPMH